MSVDAPACDPSSLAWGRGGAAAGLACEVGEVPAGGTITFRWQGPRPRAALAVDATITVLDRDDVETVTRLTLTPGWD